MLVWLITKQGRASPRCSLPLVGFKFMRITSPRCMFMIQQPLKSAPVQLAHFR